MGPTPDFNHRVPRLQLEAELFLNRGEDAYIVWIGFGLTIGWNVRRVGQLEVIGSDKPRIIQDRTIQEGARDSRDHVVDGCFRPGNHIVTAIDRHAPQGICIGSARLELRPVFADQPARTPESRASHDGT